MTAPLLRLFASLLLAFALAAAPTRGLAQSSDDDEEAELPEVAPDPLTADYKGMIGLGLIGAELGFVVPALAGARDAWIYIVFPVLGAGGGAVAGYFLLEKGDGEPELAVAALTAGMALVIPALVITLAATAYEPELEAPAMAKAAREARLAAAAGPGLLRFSERGLLLAPPAITSGPTVSHREALRTGMARTSSTRMALVSGVF